MIHTRDAIGERTLYYALGKEGATVSHRLRDLRSRASGVDLEALRDYLTCAFVPGGRTMFGGVRELRPGESIDTDTGIVTLGPELREGAWSDEDTLQDHAARLRPLLECAVRDRLPAAGEPVGVYLSGGLDSSLVAALVARMHDGPVHTFSLHFGPNTPSELLWSSLVAEHCRTRHHVLEFSARVVWSHFRETVRALDDPIGDPLTVPNLLLGKAAQAEGIRTIFNGEGGDPRLRRPEKLADGTSRPLRQSRQRCRERVLPKLPEVLRRSPQVADGRSS